VVVLSVVPIVLVIVIPIFLAYYYVQKQYRSSSRELQRLESIARTPIYAEFGEALKGLHTLRGYGKEQRFKDRHETATAKQLRVLMLLSGASQWLSFRLSFMGALVVAVVTLFVVSFPTAINAALVGLALNYALQVTDSLNGLLQAFTNAEINLVSMERIDVYGSLENEGPVTLPGDSARVWPTQGRVVFTDVALRYRPELPLVLTGVTLEIPGGSSCGIVGRTGAGKSSLLVALLRLAPLEAGRIEIDDTDIATVGLHTLRQRVALIPQDPVLFSGSVRYNLDPFNEHADDVLWALLDKVQIGEAVRSREGLPSKVETGGENFSVGQRQLLCLARALLRSAKVVLLDEATASVDRATDDLLQAVLAQEVKSARATLLVIAHRIHTILNFDRVLYLEGGEKKEMGPVKELFHDKKSKFHALARDDGIKTWPLA